VEVAFAWRYDNAGDALASHRQWIFANEAYLEGPDGKLIAYDAFDTTAQGKNDVGLAYRFRTNRPLEETDRSCTRHRATMLPTALSYEVKDIRLP